MKKLKFVVSLTTHDNDYQVEQAAAAEDTARRLGVEVEVLYAENDAILQSQQLLKFIQSKTQPQPDGIIFEPVGTALPQVARAAVTAGIPWAVLNREVEYIADLRRSFKVPVFSLTSDHQEIGRIQGKQIAALLPQGGSVLLVQGPAENLATKQRTEGMHQSKPANVQVKAIKANWTEASAHKAVTSWLKLATSQQASIDLVAAHDDSMAIGSRKAFQDIPDSALRDRWLALPFLGIDGMRDTGQEDVLRGQLAATIIVPTNTGQAIEILAHALRTSTTPPPNTFTVARSFPSIEELVKRPLKKSKTAGI